MGLLDDAIREHLELRRRHGADPAQVAREELDALAPVVGDEEPESLELAGEGSYAEESGRTPFDCQHTGNRVTGVRDASRSNPLSPSAMQETAEIDMRAVLGDVELDDVTSWTDTDNGSRTKIAAPVAAGVPRSRFAAEIDGDPPGWEVPGWEVPAPRVRRIQRQRASGGELSAEAPAS
jgi:hypothetical protein